MSDEERWEQIANEDKNKRIKLGGKDIVADKRDVAYLNRSAQKRGVSMSCRFEQMVSEVFFFGFLEGCVHLMCVDNCGNSKRREQINVDKAYRARFPKLTLHPVYHKMLKTEAQKREISLSLVLHLVIDAYRGKYPLYVPNSTTPPFFKP